MILLVYFEARTIKVCHSFTRFKLGRMAYNGSTLIAIYPGETPNMATVPLATYLQSNCGNVAALPKDIQEKIAFLHGKGVSVGPEHLNPEDILIVESKEGPNSILTIQREGSSAEAQQDDIRAAGELFHLIWTSCSRVPDFLESDLISKMTQEATSMTASEASGHFAFWSSSKRLSFLMKVSDILELKQRKHMEAVEADSRSASY